MNNHIQIIIFLMQAAALWVFFAFLVRDYALDRLRQNLFKIRGELFDRVVAEGGSFEEPGYQHLRSYINQVIRRGHMVSPSRSLLHTLLSHLPFVTGGVTAKEMRNDVNEQIKELEELGAADERVQKVRVEVHSELLQYYFLTSPVFWVLIGIAAVIVICGSGIFALHMVFTKAFDQFFARDIDRGISSLDDELGGKVAHC
jgi:hypothetical protein